LREEIKIKNLNYGFWRLDKYKKILKINNGGWHFSFLGNANFIASKIKSYVHDEYDREEYTNLEKINLRIKNMVDPFDRKKKLVKIPIDSSFPEYIQKNKDKYKELII
jgi:beta-1,4-mannosyl-glycoprotein beta-1,4-N-acetylglucosaminyltransferase